MGSDVIELREGLRTQIVLTTAHLEQVLRALARDPERIVVCQAGLNHSHGYIELIGRRWELADGRKGLPSQIDPWFAVALAPDLLRGGIGSLSQGSLGRAILSGGAAAIGGLFLGQGQYRGRVRGFLRHSDGTVEPLHALKIVGPGMHRILTTEGTTLLREPSPTASDRQRWSRTAAALGRKTWDKLISLRYGVVGCGRTGSIAATSLARLGVRRLVLIDPDRLEPHNLDAMDGVSVGDLGKAKVEALAQSLVAINPNLWLHALADSITSVRAWDLAKGSDLILCCSDTDASRLAAAYLAALYLKPLLDIGTGIFYQRGRELREMGADVRLILPGDRCLFCFGGVADSGQAKDLLASGRAEAHFLSGRNWRSERAGSLRSLNQLAASLGLRLIEDLVEGRIRRSVWLRVQYDEHGIPSLQSRTPHEAVTGTNGCAVCARAGSADAGVVDINELLSRPEGAGGVHPTQPPGRGLMATR